MPEYRKGGRREPLRVARGRAGPARRALPQPFRLPSAGVLLFLVLLGAGWSSRAGAVAPPRSPNIIVVLVDDLGYADFSCYGGRVRTPNIDRLAAEGLRFTQFYVNAPICSPSRAALLTGQYPAR